MSEIRELAERVKELRQELESVEARLRELSGDGALEPIEGGDSPTVLTTNHGLRRARAERMTQLTAALFGVVVLGGGITLGYALRGPSAEAPAASSATTTTTTTTTTPAPAESTSAAAPATEAPAAASNAAAQASASAAVPAPGPATGPTTTITSAAVTASSAPPPIVPASRKNVDRGF